MQTGSNLIAKTALILPNVLLGKNVIVEDFCIIGALPKNYNGGKTIIGDNAVIRSHSVIYAGNQIGKNFQTGNRVNVRESNTIGDDVSIGTGSVIEHHITVKNGARIHSLAFVPEYSTLEEKCWLGPKVTLTNAKFPCSPRVKENLSGPIIGRNTKIGANVTVLPGVKIGENSLIGAGSVVTKDVEANSIYAGNPAKFLRRIDY